MIAPTRIREEAKKIAQRLVDSGGADRDLAYTAACRVMMDGRRPTDSAVREEARRLRASDPTRRRANDG